MHTDISGGKKPDGSWVSALFEQVEAARESVDNMDQIILKGTGIPKKDACSEKYVFLTYSVKKGREHNRKYRL